MFLFVQSTFFDRTNTFVIYIGNTSIFSFPKQSYVHILAVQNHNLVI